MKSWTSVIVLLTFGLAAGCSAPGARTSGPHPTPRQVLDMTRAGKSPREIIADIRDSRQPYILNSGEVQELLRQGVDPKVVDAMLDSPYREDRYRHLRSTYHETYLPIPLRQQGQGRVLP